MNKKDLRIIFMGTPDFAVPSLDILVKNGWNIVAVVTTPDKPAGRGLKVHESAVKQYAISKNLLVLQPEKLRTSEFKKEIEELQPDVMVVVAFRILPREIFTISKKGTFNLHASLLPDYRGAAPINWAIMRGESESGVTTFFLEDKVDTGNIIFQEKVKIKEEETAGEMHDKLMEAGAKLVLKTVEAIAAGAAPNQPQPQVQKPKNAPKIFTETCKIDFTNSVDEAHNFIRGLSPYPAAWFDLNGKRVKIFKATKEKITHNLAAGTVATDNKTYFKLTFPDGYLDVQQLQMEGKRKMEVEEFLKGWRA